MRRLYSEEDLKRYKETFTEIHVESESVFVKRRTLNDTYKDGTRMDEHRCGHVQKYRFKLRLDGDVLTIHKALLTECDPDDLIELAMRVHNYYTRTRTRMNNDNLRYVLDALCNEAVNTHAREIIKAVTL